MKFFNWLNYMNVYINYCTSIYIILKVKGDNYRRTREGEDGNWTFEIGCDLFKRKGDAFTESDTWWLIDMVDIIKPLNDLQIVKVTSNRIKYIFDDENL